MAGKTTIGDVAAAADVSVATVDRVLNRRGGVAPDKERRVLAAARRLKIDRVLGGGYARRLRVAVLIQGAGNPFHAALGAAVAGTVRPCAEFNLQLLVYHIDPNDPERSAATVATVARSHDGLIVSSPGDPAVAAALREAAARIPVVTLATDIPESGRHAYVGPDDRQSGRIAGELMGRFLGPVGGEVLMIAGLLSIEGQRHRAEGFEQVLATHFPSCRLGAVVESREDAWQAGEMARAALGRSPGLRGLYVATVGAGAVAEALDAVRRPNGIVITHELTADRRTLLARRRIHAVIDQDPVGEVHAAIDTLARLLGRLDGPLPPPFTPVQIHTAESIGT